MVYISSDTIRKQQAGFRTCLRRRNNMKSLLSGDPARANICYTEPASGKREMKERQVIICTEHYSEI